MAGALSTSLKLEELRVGGRAFIRLARFENAVLPALAVLAGAVAHTGTAPVTILMRMLALILIHSVITIWNDIADETSDRYNGITRIGAVKQAGSYKWLVGLQYVAVGVVAVLAAFMPLDIIALLLMYVLLGWVYNVPPVQASHRPIGSISVLALSYGLIPFLIGSGVQSLGWRIWLLAICWMLVRASLSLLKDYKDAVGDAKAHKRTFLLTYGNKRTVRLSLALAYLGYTGIVALVPRGRYALAAGLTLGVGAIWLLVQRNRLRSQTTYAQLNRCFHEYLEYEIVFDSLAILWLSLH